MRIDRFDLVVRDLGVEHRARAALRQLMDAGAAAVPALRRGLTHENPAVRMRCCVVLDHHLEPDAVPELIENLDHEDDRVRAWALHALACDRCKEGECRPGEDDAVPIALRMLREDESRHVRTMAAHMLGPAAHGREDVAAALAHARDHDPHPVVRKVAGWHAPGGPIYRRTAPRTPRLSAASRS